MKPKLLVIELWGLGDLMIATPFLRAAAERFTVTLLAKPYATDLGRRFWPSVRVVPFSAPWTAFQHKYQLWRWPWAAIWRVRRTLRRERFDCGLSARWDPRDHFLLRVFGARRRFGFPRMRSQMFLDHPLLRPPPAAHRYESWRFLARELGFELPPVEKLALPHARNQGEVLVHTGAGQAVRVWPLPRVHGLVATLRASGYRVRVACDPDQHGYWLALGELDVIVARSVDQLADLIDRADAFVGNDSGPGHLAAFSGVPTFTVFGPQLPEWFGPLHPASEWTEGKPCPFKPCSDYCRFPEPRCMTESSEAEVTGRVIAFLRRVMGAGVRT